MKYVWKWYIYRLFSSKEPDITKYVGITYDLENRIKGHITSAPKSNTPSGVWINKLNMAGIPLGYEKISTIYGYEPTDCKYAYKAETFWIHYYTSIGQPLLNVSKVPRNFDYSLCEV